MRRVSIDSGEIDLSDGRITGGDTRLSARELALVRFLVGQDTPSLPDTLLVEVWGYRPGVKSRTVYSTVDRIRRKIEVDPTEPQHLVTVEGGYCFVPTPAEVVPPEGTFGRQRDLSNLVRALCTDGVVVLHGPGGVGKTHLAHAAFGHGAARFRKRTWVELRGVALLTTAFERIRIALGVVGDQEDDLRSALAAQGPLLVVLDDLDDLDDQAAELLSRLGTVPGCTLLATTRTPMQRARCQAVAPLSERSAAELLRAKGRTQLSIDALRPLIARLDGLPLALELVAPWLDELGVDAFVGQGIRIDGVTACVARSWARLQEQERAALGRIAAVGGRLPSGLVVRLLSDTGLETLHRLRAVALLTVAAGWVTMLETVRAFVRSQVGTRTEDARNVAIVWVEQRCAETVSSLGTPGQPTALRTIRAELPLIVEVLREARRGVSWCRAVVDLAAVLTYTGLLAPMDAWLNEVVDIAPTDELRFLARVRMSAVATRRGSDALAPVQGEAPTTLSAQVLAEVWFARGAALQVLGRFDEANKTLQRVRDLSPTNSLLLRRTFHRMCQVHAARRDWDQLLQDVGDLERLAELAGDPHHQAMAAAMRGVHARDHGRIMQAEMYWRQGRALAMSGEDGEAAAHLSESLSTALMAQEKEGEARRLLSEAQRFYSRHGLLGSQGFVLIALGGIELHAHNDANAEQHFLLAADAFQRSRFPRGQAAALGMLGRLYTGQGKLQLAIEAYDRILEALGPTKSETTDDVIFALRAVCLLQLGDRSPLTRVRALPDDGPFRLLKSLVEDSASKDPETLAAVRSVVRGRELDRSGITI